MILPKTPFFTKFYGNDRKLIPTNSLFKLNQLIKLRHLFLEPPFKKCLIFFLFLKKISLNLKIKKENYALFDFKILDPLIRAVSPVLAISFIPIGLTRSKKAFTFCSSPVISTVSVSVLKSIIFPLNMFAY